MITLLGITNIKMINQVQLYNDKLDFEENKTDGPFGEYASNNKIYLNRGEPKYDFFGVPVYSPFGIAAGPLPTTRFVKSALNLGFDIVTLKSVRTDTYPLNPYPQVRPVILNGRLKPHKSPPVVVAKRYSQHLAVANSFGIPSVRPDIWQPEMKRSLVLPGRGQALLVAFQGTARGQGRKVFVQDHIKGVGLIKSTGAKIIEINLSCPNEGEEILACFDPDITEKIVAGVREVHPDVKLIIKLAYFDNKKLLKQLIARVGHMLDGISAINTIPHEVVDKNGNAVFPGRPTAGISGAPIKWAGLEMVKSLSSLRSELSLDYKIIGIGGVLNPNDFHEYRQAGADIVMSVTGAMWFPDLASDIKASLNSL